MGHWEPIKNEQRVLKYFLCFSCANLLLKMLINRTIHALEKYSCDICNNEFFVTPKASGRKKTKKKKGKFQTARMPSES